MVGEMNVIEPVDYTEQIERVIAKLKYRMDSTLVKYSADDIIVIKDGDMTHILANPVISEELVYDELEQKLQPMRNVTALWVTSSSDGEVRPVVRMIRSDLYIMILPDGTIKDGGLNV
jgi:hypothetical protein